jgi:hypothetical protein
LPTCRPARLRDSPAGRPRKVSNDMIRPVGATVAVTTAALNNAEWCDVVCRTNGIFGVFEANVWASQSRTPPYFPDAVTLESNVADERILKLVDTTPGCSVKDSFASLDLAPAGFHILFEAEWISRSTAPPVHPSQGRDRLAADPHSPGTGGLGIGLEWRAPNGSSVPSGAARPPLCSRPRWVPRWSSRRRFRPESDPGRGGGVESLHECRRDCRRMVLLSRVSGSDLAGTPDRRL